MTKISKTTYELTLEPTISDLSAELTIEPVEVTQNNILSDEEVAEAEEFSEKIELKNANMVLMYGAGAQRKIAVFSETALENVRTKDLDEVGNLLTKAVVTLKGFQVDEKDSGIFAFFKKKVNSLTVLKTKYETTEQNIETICKELEKHQIQLLKDISILDNMYKLNKTYFKELAMYLVAGRKKLEKTRSEELPQLVKKAEKSGAPEDAQEANDIAALCERFEKRLHDLELTKAIAIQAGPQIRLVQNNNVLISEKIQSTLVNTIPLWKSQMVLAIGIHHSLNAAKAQNAVNDFTNELLKNNAEKLKQASVMTAKESERGIVDIETLQNTNRKLIETFDEIMKIQQDGSEKRKLAEVELQKIETDLKNKLLEIRR